MLKPIERISAELSAALESVATEQFEQLVAAFADRGRRWFFSGQGRSGLIAAMAAMRFTHLGFRCHVVGEATAPAIGAGDAMMVISASGETAITCSFARIAEAAGAEVLALSRNADSELGSIADKTLVVAPAESRQFGGSLFEQAALVLLDAVALSLTDADPSAHAKMAQRHTNLQ